MLTPDFLEKIEFNKIVDLYNRLNIEITAEIIERIANMEEITATTEDKMKILIQTNGDKIFNEILEKTSMLSAERKNMLKQLFERMAKEDVQGYKELFEYKEIPFTLSESQLKILNEGLRLTNNTLNNFTNTIAFQSQQTYVDAIDRAYMQVVSGAFDYATSINTIVQELADKGITLKDKLGRNVQLEVAVRRNIMSGIQFTANNINRDIEKQLGCDGYEVTAHVGARPSHAEEQGKQFALNIEDAEKYKIGLWSDVEHLWNEYNCRHTYFGIILGVSEPIYSNKELKEYKKAKVKLNGKEIPYYEATQRQRQLENIVRKKKRAVQILEKAGQDTKEAKTKLAIAQKNLNEFCKNTGLQKDYSRIKVAKYNSTNITKYDTIPRNTNSKDKKMQYIDITDEIYNQAKPNRGKIEKKRTLEIDGKTYTIDGHNVVYKHDERELEVARLLNKTFGGNVKILPNINFPQGIKTPDYLYKGERTDLKRITSKRANDCVKTALKNKEKQADNFIIDNTAQTVKDEDILKQINEIYNSKGFSWINKIYVLKDNKFIKVFKRK